MNEAMRKSVDTWNRKYPIGTPVMRCKLIRPNRDRVGPVKTASAAWMMSEHTAVIKVEGVSGCVALESLEPLEP